MLKEKAGIIMIALGVSTANSEDLIVPLLFMGVGLWLIRGLITWE